MTNNMKHKISKHFILVNIWLLTILFTPQVFGIDLSESNIPKQQVEPEKLKPITQLSNQSTNIGTNEIQNTTMPVQNNKEVPQSNNNNITDIPLIIGKDQYDIDTKDLSIEDLNTNISSDNKNLNDSNTNEIIDKNLEQEHFPIISDEKREYTRYNNATLTRKIAITAPDYINNILDLSRGGIGFGICNNKEIPINVGDTISLIITYKDVSIPLEIKVIDITTNRICSQYINLSEEQKNKLLYITIMIEADNKTLTTSKITS